jgi:hypothetical protein
MITVSYIIREFGEKKRNVFFPFPQGGYFYANGAKPVVKVFSELAFLSEFE